MKRLDTFIEGLLDKSNKAKTMDISDIDMRNIEELKMALPDHKEYPGNAVFTPSDGLCLIMGHKYGNKYGLPVFEFFVKIDEVLYDFYVCMSVLLRDKQRINLEIIPTEEHTSMKFINYGYLWGVDMAQAKKFIQDQVMFHEDVYVEDDVSAANLKLFKKWLGIDFRVK